jgi:hypothetical protein
MRTYVIVMGMGERAILHLNSFTVNVDRDAQFGWTLSMPIIEAYALALLFIQLSL